MCGYRSLIWFFKKVKKLKNWILSCNFFLNNKKPCFSQIYKTINNKIKRKNKNIQKRGIGCWMGIFTTFFLFLFLYLFLFFSFSFLSFPLFHFQPTPKNKQKVVYIYIYNIILYHYKMEVSTPKRHSVSSSTTNIDSSVKSPRYWHTKKNEKY